MRDARRPFRLFDGTLDHLAAPGPGRLIVTPNLDHLRLLTRSNALRRAYRAADVVLNDSRFLDRAFYCGQAFCLTGADLAPEMLERLPAGAHVLVIGCIPAVETALAARWPALVFSFRNPTMGYIKKRAERPLRQVKVVLRLQEVRQAPLREVAVVLRVQEARQAPIRQVGWLRGLV